jgi:nucleotide-binding universal stress UspA family protein
MYAQTVAVGVGGGDASWSTLAWAVDDAAVVGGRLLVCHVCSPDSPLASVRGRPSMATVELADPSLARAIAAAQTRLGGHRVELIVATGHVGAALAAAADRADLLVVGAPRHSGWVQRSSTTHHVITHAHCPTVVVRPVTSRTHGPFAGHVVVGVDGSTGARAALEFGFEYAGSHRLPLAAVHVGPHDHEDIWFDETTLETHVVDVSEGLVLLADEVDPWRLKYPSVAVKRALYSGRPLPGLLRAASGARLLVVGDQGRGPTVRAFIGSVAHGAVDRAHCPVMVAHPDRSREERAG